MMPKNLAYRLALKQQSLSRISAEDGTFWRGAMIEYSPWNIKELSMIFRTYFWLRRSIDMLILI